jgi:hypothetical protein
LASSVLSGMFLRIDRYVLSNGTWILTEPPRGRSGMLFADVAETLEYNYLCPKRRAHNLLENQIRYTGNDRHVLDAGSREEILAPSGWVE